MKTTNNTIRNNIFIGAILSMTSVLAIGMIPETQEQGPVIALSIAIIATCWLTAFWAVENAGKPIKTNQHWKMWVGLLLGIATTPLAALLGTAIQGNLSQFHWMSHAVCLATWGWLGWVVGQTAAIHGTRTTTKKGAVGA